MAGTMMPKAGDRLSAYLALIIVLVPALVGDASAAGSVERIVVDARSRYRLEPVYPPQALAQGVEGEITVGFTIDVYGAVRDPQVTAADPRGAFEAAALGIVRPWLFTPAMEPFLCRQHEQSAEQTFRFRVADGGTVETLPLKLGEVAGSDPTIVRVEDHDAFLAEFTARSPQTRLPMLRPIPIETVEARFPGKARHDGTPGLVSMKFMITERGAVKGVEVTSSHPPGLYDASAVAALKRWKFQPEMRNGTPVETPACQSFRFNLISCPRTLEGRVWEVGDPCVKLLNQPRR